MKRWASWIRNAVTPRRAEVRQAENILPPRVLQYCRQATEPTVEELAALVCARSPVLDAYRKLSEPDNAAVARVVARLHARPPRPLWTPIGVGVLGTFAAIAMAALIWIGSGDRASYGAPTLPVGVAHHVEADQTHYFGPSIEMRASASVQVLQADEAATLLRLDEGSTHFEVDPTGPFRSLIIEAAAVQVSVKGTVFGVHREGEIVRVDVARGVVEVRHDQTVVLVSGGEHWTNAVRVTVAPTPSSEPTVGDQPADAHEGVIARISNPQVTEKPKALKAQDAMSLHIEPSTIAFHTIMAARDSGARTETLEEMVDAFQRQYPDSVHERAAVEIRVQAIIAGPELPRAVNTLTLWLEEERTADRLSVRREVHYRALRATLLRDGLNDCEAALEDYNYLSRRAAEPLRSEAYAWLGLCASGLGQPARARAALSQVDLKRLPKPLRAQVKKRTAALKSTRSGP